jgi:hypothetical protein
LKINEVRLMQTLKTSSTAHVLPPAGSCRRQTIATILGERQFASINWRRLLQDGALVRLHIAGGSLFWAGLTYEDLGIRVEDNEVRQKLSRWVTLGKKRLLPEAYMKSLTHIESSARYTLKERSFRTELGAFVPSSAYLAWRDMTEALKTQYEALRDDIIANHTPLTRAVLGEYEGIAAETYQRLHLVQPELLTEGRDPFIAHYCQRIASQIPSPDRIREKLDFKYLLLEGPAQVGESLPEQTGGMVEMNPPTLEQVRSETQQREWQRAILQHDLRVHAQERIDMVLDDFLSSVVGQLRNLTYEAVCDVLITMQRRSNASVSPRSIVQLNHLLAQIRALNFYGDDELERMLAQIEQIVEQRPAERQASLADIQRTLRAIATATRATLLDLGEEPRSAREVGISDYPTESAVRQARAEIGLDLDAVQFTNLAQIRADVRAERAEVSANGMESLWSLLENETPRGARAV